MDDLFFRDKNAYQSKNLNSILLETLDYRDLADQ